MNKRPFVLNEEQKDAARITFNTPITLLYGPAGTGKTGTALHIAMKMRKDKLIDQIVLTRPAVSTEDYGFLPGDVGDKFETPYLAPLIEFVNKFGDNKNPAPNRQDNSSAYEKMKAKNEVVIQPLAFMRGQTFDNSVVIFDEVQNSTPQQMKMVLTRIGQNSKIILCGDVDQCDLNRYKVPVNGLEAVLQLVNHTKHVAAVELLQCERSPIIDDIIKGWALLDLGDNRGR